MRLEGYGSEGRVRVEEGRMGVGVGMGMATATATARGVVGRGGVRQRPRAAAQGGGRASVPGAKRLGSVAAGVGLCVCLAAGFGDVAGAGASDAGAAFVGRYADAKHPGCLREISGAGAALDVTGTDGTPGCTKGEKQTPWALTGQLNKQGDAILIDFTPKGGPKDLVGKKTEAGILFPDGNEWKKLAKQ